MVWIMKDIYAPGIQFAWGPIVLAELYQDLYIFITIYKFNMMMAHSNLLQVWAYEHISMI